MQRYRKLSYSTINPDSLVPAAMLAQAVLSRTRRSFTSSLSAGEAWWGTALIGVGVICMMWALVSLADPALALWLDGLAALASGVITVDRARSGMTAQELARDVLGRIQRAALAVPLIYRLEDMLGLPALADLSLIAASRQPFPPPPDLPAGGITLTPRLAPTPIPTPAAN